MKEIWKEIKQDSRYEVSNLGRVKRKSNNRIRKPSISKNGYHTVVFSNPSGKHKAHYIHRLVAQHFISDCPDGMEVSHVDGDQSNNAVENIVYETHSANIRRKAGHGTNNTGSRNGGAKLTLEQVLEIREKRANGALLREISHEYSVSFQQVSRICKMNNWS